MKKNDRLAHEANSANQVVCAISLVVRVSPKIVLSVEPSSPYVHIHIQAKCLRLHLLCACLEMLSVTYTNMMNNFIL